LLVALDGRLGFGEALGKGIRVSWAGVGRWGPAVGGQLLLLGFVTFLAVSYTETRPGGYPTPHSTHWSREGFGVGGYENGCRWYAKLMEALAAPTWAPVATALGLLFGALAVVIKLHIAARLPVTAPLDKAPVTEVPSQGDGEGTTAYAPDRG